MTSSDVWDSETAERYETDSAEQFLPEVVDPTVDVLEALADGGPALELAIGTGRIGVPLAERGVPVSGIELSEPMVGELRRKVGEHEIPVVVGDMATALAPGAGDYALVYLVWNTIGNLRTQAEQVHCFQNAARHLRTGGRFVVDVGVPKLRRLPPGETVVAATLDDGHLVFDTYDVVTQGLTSHHYHHDADGSVRYGVGNFRYVWPSELDLMAQIAGLALESRWSDWHGGAFTGESTRHVSVWCKR